jgi:hypothetical protein
MVPAENASSINLVLSGGNHLVIDPSTKYGVGILMRLDAFNRRQVGPPVIDLVVKVLTRLIGCEAKGVERRAGPDASRNIGGQI